MLKYRRRRRLIFFLGLLFLSGLVFLNPQSYQTKTTYSVQQNPNLPLATTVLSHLEVKGRAPKTHYHRKQFYNSWPKIDGCSLRQQIIKREFGDQVKTKGCDVISGSFFDSYLGQNRQFDSKSEISKALQIDHIVALSDAWQKGAALKTKAERFQIATDPLNLIAADGPANMQKGDSDAASWLPPNKAFRCQYVSRQIAVKYKYRLWVTLAEKQAISQVLDSCPGQTVIGLENFPEFSPQN